MARPLKIKYSGATVVGAQEMSDAEIDYIAHQICAKIAAQTNGTGNLTLNVNGASGTSIGTFVDTWRPDAVGSHPVGTTVNSATTTFKQVKVAATAPYVRSIEWSSSAMREMTDAALASTVYPRVLARLATPGLGSYVLQPSAPATGSWVSVATITDTAQSGNSTTTLWRCTSYSTPTTYRSLKAYSNTGMREMSDADLQSLFTLYSSYAVNNGPGLYAVQSAAPVGGTWVRMGSAFSDTIQQLSNIAYTGSYSGTYTGSYSANYAGAYAGNYSGAYAGAYTRLRTVGYARPYYYSGYASGVAGYYTTTFTGYYTGYYTGTYTGYYTGYYAGSRSNTYAGSRSRTYTGTTVVSTKDTPSNISLWLRTA